MKSFGECMYCHKDTVTNIMLIKNVFYGFNRAKICDRCQVIFDIVLDKEGAEYATEQYNNCGKNIIPL